MSDYETIHAHLDHAKQTMSKSEFIELIDSLKNDLDLMQLMAEDDGYKE